MINTPSNLELLLHCYYSPEPHERFNAPAIQEGFDYLVAHEMIELTNKRDVYRATERGEAFIQHLMTVPFPVAVWLVPFAPEKAAVS